MHIATGKKIYNNIPARLFVICYFMKIFNLTQ